MSDPLVYSFCFAGAMVVPVLLVIAGYAMGHLVPSEPNNMIGYRTRLSMSSQQAWDYANRECGRQWKKLGLILLGVSAAAMIPAWFADPDAIVMYELVLTGVQIAAMLASIASVQKKLHRMFHDDGTLRQQLP